MTANSTTSARAADDMAVRRVLDEAYAAWVAGDADAFVARYTEDATSVTTPGDFRKNRDEIRDRLAEGFDGPFKGSKVIDEVQSVRFPGDHMAVVVSKSGIVPAGETEVPADRWLLATWVFSKRNGTWFIAAYHNCPLPDLGDS